MGMVGYKCTEEEVDGRPVDEIAKIAGPVGGLWVAWNDHGISGASFANTTTFARFREEHAATRARVLHQR